MTKEKKVQIKILSRVNVKNRNRRKHLSSFFVFVFKKIFVIYIRVYVVFRLSLIENKSEIELVVVVDQVAASYVLLLNYLLSNLRQNKIY